MEGGFPSQQHLSPHLLCLQCSLGGWAEPDFSCPVDCGSAEGALAGILFEVRLAAVSGGAHNRI